ncbi:hypothetical protein COCMIDRAFT_104747 [Bipolaris oryzae ATCC 44560]|uniref:J domain-containing protein n=1 Tax=Bipolaris oryzae ATCC 44560 TaxID=930090 RepID=W6YWS5_COCMI|nr:uncharacterized protein COCMIDRAFT_104747 [Bipolaris oryzae ATCC 44560]EUC41973.1 hypothetical protein COCMIDRAFT_104747 [Bipolaris oryzae ATCC 44560]
MEPEGFEDYYATLGLQLGASPNAIRSAFHALAIKYHPDGSGISDSTLFRAAREAFDRLTNTEFRKEYDRTYWRKKLHIDPPAPSTDEQPFGNTRTYQYEAEMRERARRASPPPKKPFKKPGDPGWKYLNSAAYQKWKQLSASYYARHPECEPPVDESRPPSPGQGGLQHGLLVKMSHECVLRPCRYRSATWKVQPGGADHCVFCMEARVGCSRCPGCEALACQKCLKKIAEIEQNSCILSNKAPCATSGG